MGRVEVTLFLDACIVIYWVEAPDPFHSRLMEHLRSLRQQHPDATFAVSRLSWLECMVKPLRDKDATLLEAYREFFEARHLQIVDLSARVVERAASLRAEHELKTPDALQAASALEVDGELLFITNDHRFRKISALRVEIPQ